MFDKQYVVLSPCSKNVCEFNKIPLHLLNFFQANFC
jgi:hypothetical protein